MQVSIISSYTQLGTIELQRHGTCSGFIWTLTESHGGPFTTVVQYAQALFHVNSRSCRFSKKETLKGSDLSARRPMNVFIEEAEANTTVHLRREGKGY